MKNLLLFLILAINHLTLQAQTRSLFEPYKKTELHLPAVPLIMNDPYFSIWSPYLNLYDGATKHWSGVSKSIDGYLSLYG